MLGIRYAPLRLGLAGLLLAAVWVGAPATGAAKAQNAPQEAAAPPPAQNPSPDAAPDGDEDPAARAPRCLRTQLIRHSEIIDNKTIILHMAGKRKFRMSLAYECYGLKFHQSFYYKSYDARLCRNDIIISRAGSNCPVKGFEEIIDAPAAADGAQRDNEKGADK